MPEILDTEYDRGRFSRTIEMIPALPWQSKRPSVPPLLNKHKTRGCKECERGASRNFLHSFPLSSIPVVQSYWAWKFGLSEESPRKPPGRGRNLQEEMGASSFQKTREGCCCAKLLAGKVFRQISTLLDRFSGSTKCYPYQGFGIFRQGEQLLENWMRLLERCWIFSSETATAFLSFFF